MPLYKVSYESESKTYEASCPSAAASKAFNSLRRQGHEGPLLLTVYTEGKRFSSKYKVTLEPLEDPNEHEKKFGISFVTRARKVVD